MLDSGKILICYPSMSLCINPSCPRPDNPANHLNRFCGSCGSDLSVMGRYQVMRLISDRTGFGKIYEAQEEGTTKTLKILKENLNQNAKAVELFEQEASVLGELNHPGIPQVDGYFQYQTRNGLLLHCITMEKIEGVNLEEWMAARGNRPISEDRAILWLKQITVILQLIHHKSYLHRDIKPSNIMLRNSLDRGEDRLVLIDFGTAREVTRTYLAKLSAGHRITAIVSTGYTAPEQMTGDATAQSDFFALGRTFVFLLTGQHPDTMYSHRTDDLNWRNYTSGISPQFLNLIDWLMMSDSRQRPANAREILDRIAAIEGQTIGTSTTTVAIGGNTTTLPPNMPLPSEDEGRKKWFLVAFLLFLTVTWGLIALTALGFSYSERSWLAPNAQAPQKKGDVDYFPYVEGKDSQGKTAEFNVAVLSREYKWELGSSSQVNYNSRLIPVESLQSNLTEEGIQKIMNNPSEIISVGTASCEGTPATEEARAFSRAEQIQLLGKKLFRDVGSVKNYRLLNLGQFRGENCQANKDQTAYQRSIIIIGVGKQTDGVILDEALRSRLEAKPFGDFQIKDYSLGGKDKFKTIPSRL